MPRLTDVLTRRTVGAYDSDSLSGRARLRRWEEFATTFPRLDEMKVLDLGGDARAWRGAPVRPAHITLLNIFEQEVDEPWMDAIVGDACDPDFELPEADLVYSNSVIEHVGGHWRRERFAAAARSRGRYWVQTPNRYFPIEPHFMMPWLQHLPRGIQGKLIVAWPLGNHAPEKDPEQALRDALEIELVSMSEMRFYFPDAEIRRERFAGLTKSFIAVKHD
ncbi:MAG TPA: hypothetical protein VGG40_03420 [Solirubrobacterales bacterium]